MRRFNSVPERKFSKNFFKKIIKTVDKTLLCEYNENNK